jgi:hypothetical protein
MSTMKTVAISDQLHAKLMIVATAEGTGVDRLAAALLADGISRRLADRRAALPGYLHEQARLREKLRGSCR